MAGRITSKTMNIRKAVIKDAREIHRLINDHAKKGLMLPRALNEIYTTIRDHIVCEVDGEIVGVCALHILWEDLAEIRSLAIRDSYQHRKIGSSLVKRCVSEARRLGLRRIFVLTYVPDFFRTMGFKDLDKTELPHKIWSDCVKCHKFPDCDEYALIKEVL